MTQPQQSDIQKAFEEFHASNPHVYTSLARLARQAKARGHRRIGIELLFAVLRWESLLATESTDGFKLNDHMTSRYSRLLMAQEPDLEGMFAVRQLRSAGPRHPAEERLVFDEQGQGLLVAA